MPRSARAGGPSAGPAEGLPANLLCPGDNLDVLRRHVPARLVDLAYLDPPFNSGTRYSLPKPGRSTGTAVFADRWPWNERAEASFAALVQAGGDAGSALHALSLLLGRCDTLAYLTMLAPRLLEVRRALKETGVLYLHCDPRTSHYLKIMLDALFGAENFRNEIVWYYGGRGAKAIARQFPRNHDIILVYARSAETPAYTPQYTWRSYTPRDARSRGFRQDGDGRWFKTAPRGDYTDDSIRALRAEGRIHQTRSGTVRVKYFLQEDGGAVVEDVLVGDVWPDIADAMHMGSERAGYPTQKPEALLERIILAGSREGDVVLDPFCGSGTALTVAQRLGRRWIGIDSAPVAIELVRQRLRGLHGSNERESYRLIEPDGGPTVEPPGRDGRGAQGPRRSSPACRAEEAATSRPR